MKWLIRLFGGAFLLAFILYWGAELRLKPMSEEARSAAPGAFLKVSDGHLHYRWDGPEEGPIIVMVHGLSTPNFIFEQNVAALNQAGFRTLRFDHFGRGWSDRPNVKYDIDFYDRALVELLDGLDVTGPIGLVGLSMGGPITAEFTARHPERVSRLFLFVPAGLDLKNQDSGAARLIQIPLLGDFLWRMLARQTLLRDDDAEHDLAPDEQLQGDVTEQMGYRGYYRALLSTMRHMPMSQRDATFQAVSETSIPVMAVFGAQDEVIAVSSSERLQSLMPSADIHILPEGRHALNYENYKTVNPWLVDWFSPLEATQ